MIKHVVQDGLERKLWVNGDKTRKITHKTLKSERKHMHMIQNCSRFNIFNIVWNRWHGNTVR